MTFRSYRLAAGILWGVLSCSLTQPSLFAQDATGPTIQTCSDRQVICLDGKELDLCVTVNVPDGYAKTIESFRIDWGDGSPAYERAGSNESFNRNHDYDFETFFESCSYQQGPQLVILTVFVEGEIEPIQSIFPLTVRNPPKAEFGRFPDVVCAGESIRFGNSSCPRDQLISEWDYGDGSPADDLVVHTFMAPGTYTVKLTVSNNCDSDVINSDQTTKRITVIDVPIASGVPDSGIVAGFTEPYRVCFDGSARIRLDGSDSRGLDDVTWTASPASGIRFDDRNRRSTRATITQPGLYTLTLSGRNDNCQLPADTSFQLEVLESTQLTLTPQADECVSFVYCPDPFIPEAVYKVNGVLLEECDQTFTEGTYAVEAVLENEICGDVTLRDTFIVAAQATASIVQADTVLCDRDGPLTLTAGPAGGSWTIDGTAFNGTLDPTAYPSGTYRVAYGNEPCIQSDAITVEIVNSAVTVPEDTEICIDAEPFTFSATPPGGTFSGPFVNAGGTFDPGAAGLGEFTLYYEYDSPALAGCGSLDSFRVSVSDLAVAFNTLSCNGNEVCLEIGGSEPYDAIAWDFGDGSAGSGRNPCHTFARAGTYTVTVTVRRGPCTAIATREISIAPAPRAQFTLDYDPGRCSDLEVTVADGSTGGNLSYYWTLNGDSLSTLPTPPPVTLRSRTQDTTYTVRLELTNGCATSTFEESVVVRPIPTADFGTDKSIYCSGDTILINNISLGQPDRFEWLLNGESIGTDSVPPPVMYETEEGDTIELCLRTFNECGEDLTCRRIAVTPTSVTAFFNLDPATICVDDTVRLTSFATPGVPVRYDFGNGNGSTDPRATVVYPTAGEYTIGQRAFGCGSDLFEQSITVIDRPTALFEAPLALCPGTAASFRNTSIGDLAATWDFGDGSAPVTDFSPEHTFDSAGIYQVCLTVTSLTPDGCDHTVCTEVTVDSAPTAGFIATDSLCQNEPVRVTSLGSGTGLICTYRFGDGGEASECSADHLYAAPGQYRITQVVTDDKGCTDSTSTPVLVRALPVAGFSASQPEICFGEPVAFLNESTDATTYRWDFGDGQTSPDPSPVHEYATLGTYTISLTAVNRFCTSTVSRVVTVRERPEARIALSRPAACYGEPLTFSDNSTGSVSRRRWDFGDGTSSFESAPAHPFAEPGSYLVRLYVETESGCTDSTSTRVTVHEAVTASLRQTAEIVCQGDPSGALLVTPTGGTAPFAFQWSNGIVSPDNAGLVAGVYGVTVTDGNACIVTDSLRLTEPPALTAMATTSVVTCSGGADGTLDLTVAGGTPGYSLRWNDGQRTAAIRDLRAGDYGIRVTDAAGCADNFTFTVTEHPPVVIEDSVFQISCFGEGDGVVTINGLTGGVGPYQLTLAGSGYRRSGTTITRFDSLAPGVYTLEAVDANGCFEERDIILRKPDRVSLDILSDTLRIAQGDTVAIDSRYNAADPTFRWTPSLGLSCSDCPRPVARPFLPTRYAATITDGRGCSATDSIFIDVMVDREVYLPNTFTPNGDGRNDIFRVRSRAPASIDRVVSFEVRDRWGTVLYAAEDFPPNDPAYGWDGTYRDEQVNPGQYVFQVKVRFVDGFVKAKQGGIMILH